MDDLISRQAAIDAVHKEFDDCIVWDESGKTTANAVEEILDCVPSAQPERKTGKWIPKHSKYCRTWECSKCEYRVDLEDGGIYNFCAACGEKKG